MQQSLSAREVNVYCPLFIMMYNLAGNLSNDIYLPSLPALTHYFNTSNFFVQITMTAWFLGVTLPQLIFGILADKYGRRPLMLWGGVLFLLSTLICIVAPTIFILIIGRFFQGVSVSSLNIAAFATVKSHYYDEKVSLKLLAYINITGSLAPIIGPLVGSYIYYLLGWRATFAAVFLLAGIALSGLYYYMLESYDKDNRHNIKFDIKSIWLFYKPILLHNRIWGPIACQAAFLGALIAYLTTVPFVMKNVYFVPIEHFGFTQIVPFGFLIIGGFVMTKLVNFFSPKKIITASFIIVFISLLLLNSMRWIDGFNNIYMFLFSISLFLFGFALAASPLVSEAMSLTSLKGSSAAILSLTMALMASLSSLLTAIFFDDDVYSTIFIISIFSLSGMIIYLFVNRQRKYVSVENN